MKNTRELTLNAMFITLILIMSFVPQLGIIQLGVIAFQIIHIPVIVAGLTLGFKSGVLNGFVFGASTLYVALTRGASLLDPFFVNPLVSILPRILFGVSIGVISALVGKFVKKAALNYSITAFVSTIAHSTFVFIALYFVIFFGNTSILEGPQTAQTLFAFMIGIFASNALLEALAAMFIVPPIVIALKRIKGNR